MAGRTAIGLDIGTSVVRAAELSYGRGGVTLEKFGQVVLPEGAVRDGEVVDPNPVSEAIRQLWSATGLSHRNVVIGVANQRVIVRQIELPWLPQNELRASLPFQVQDILPMPVEQAVLDYYPVSEGQSEDGNRVYLGLLVAAARETVLGNVRCAEQAGLRCLSVDLTPFAVLRSMGRQTGIDVETEALIDIGARVTNIIIHSAGAPRFVRILLMGGQDITDAVAELLGVPTQQAEVMKQQLTYGAIGEELVAAKRAVATSAHDLVDDIRGSLDYYGASNPGNPVERVLVSGGGSRLDGLLERLSSATRLPCLAGDPLGSLRIGHTGLDEQQLTFVKPLATVPVGLALGAI